MNHNGNYASKPDTCQKWDDLLLKYLWTIFYATHAEQPILSCCEYLHRLLIVPSILSSLSQVKDETPDNWDEEEQEQEEEGEKEEKRRTKDKDLEFLFQEVVRDSSVDDSLKRSQQRMKSDPKYQEMLVSVSSNSCWMKHQWSLRTCLALVAFLWVFMLS